MLININTVDLLGRLLIANKLHCIYNTLHYTPVLLESSNLTQEPYNTRLITQALVSYRVIHV